MTFAESIMDEEYNNKKTLNENGTLGTCVWMEKNQKVIVRKQ